MFAGVVLVVVPVGAFAQEPPIMDQAPLVRGFYLTEVMTCDEASNATLGLLHKNGFNPGHRVGCEFSSITWTSPTSFSYVEFCRDPFGEDGGGIELTGSIELLSDRGFIRNAPTGTSEWYYCQQSNLPDPWSTNDIADMLK